MRDRFLVIELELVVITLEAEGDGILAGEDQRVTLREPLDRQAANLLVAELMLEDLFAGFKGVDVQSPVVADAGGEFSRRADGQARDGFLFAESLHRARGVVVQLDVVLARAEDVGSVAADRQSRAERPECEEAGGSAQVVDRMDGDFSGGRLERHMAGGCR